MKRGLAVLLLLGVASTIAAAGPGVFRSRCGPQGCPVEPVPDVADDDSYEWKPSNLAGRFMLFSGGRYVGTFDAQENAFRFYLGNGGWTDPASPPATLPAAATVRDWRRYGVDCDKLHDECTWSISGRPVSQAQAIGQALEDDSGKLWLLIIGDDREKVRKELAGDPKYAELLGRARVWTVASNHFSLVDRETGKPMWNNTGKPSLCLMKPDGTVLFDDHYTGPRSLEDLRKADPSRTPDPKPPAPEPKPAPAPEPKKPETDVKKNDPPASASVSVGLLPCCLLVGAAAAYVFVQRQPPPR